MNGKRVLITGGNTGMGLASPKHLPKKGLTLLLHQEIMNAASMLYVKLMITVDTPLQK